MNNSFNLIIVSILLITIVGVIVIGCAPANSNSSSTIRDNSLENNIQKYVDHEYGVVCYAYGSYNSLQCVKYKN